MSMLWLLLGLLALTGECISFFPNDLGVGKDEQRIIMVLLICKSALQMLFFPKLFAKSWS